MLTGARTKKMALPAFEAVDSTSGVARVRDALRARGQPSCWLSPALVHLVIVGFACGLLGLMPASVAAANGSAAADMTRSFNKARAACDRIVVSADCCRHSKAVATPPVRPAADALRCCRLRDRSNEVRVSAVTRDDGAPRNLCFAMR